MKLPEDRVVVRRRVKAPPSIAWEVWTRPEHVARWWRPTTTAECTACEMDLRVGGTYRLGMVDPADGSSCEVEGEFREVSPPKRLVYTWNARIDQGTVENSVVTVEFHQAHDEETEIVIVHVGLPDTPAGAGHELGWEQMSRSFARYVEEANA